MGIKKTLGGERLGSGSKLKVELHGYERSTHDLGYLWRSTMAPGTLVPFLCKVALPGDTFDINLNAIIKTHPTVGPLFGSYKVQLDVFLCPIRLYQGSLHNNALGIGLNMANVKLPIMELHSTNIVDIVEDQGDVDNSQVNPSCLLSYLGIRGIGWGTDSNEIRTFNAIPLLAYWEIYKNYYANKQEEIGAVIHTPNSAITENVDTITVTVNGGDYQIVAAGSGDVFTTVNDNNALIYIAKTAGTINPNNIFIKTVEFGDVRLSSLFGDFTTYASGDLVGTVNPQYVSFTAVHWRYATATDFQQVPPKVQTFELSQIDDMRMALLANPGIGVPFNVNNDGFLPYSYVLGQSAGRNNCLYSLEGLGLKTYQSDLFNNWLQTEWIDGTTGINQITAIDTSSGKFTIDTLNLAKKVYDMLNRIAVSGGTYDDWVDSVWTHDRYTRVESPVYLGGLIKELVFQEVVSNNSTQPGEDPLGTLGGRGVMADKHKGGYVNVRVDEPSYVMGLVSLTPRIDYSQGNEWDIHLKSLDDLHKPALDEIGFQDLITEQMAWWDTKYDSVSLKWVQKSAGKQPAWINYMTSVNRVYGNFAVGNGDKVGEMFMTLNRRYEADNAGIVDLTTYIDPSKFNHIFAETAIDAQNFWTQIAVDITARRKMSAKVMPNL